MSFSGIKKSRIINQVFSPVTIKNQSSVSYPSTNSKLIATLNVYADKYIRTQTPEQEFPGVHKVFPEPRK